MEVPADTTTLPTTLPISASSRQPESKHRNRRKRPQAQAGSASMQGIELPSVTSGQLPEGNGQSTRGPKRPHGPPRNIDTSHRITPSITDKARRGGTGKQNQATPTVNDIIESTDPVSSNGSSRPRARRDRHPPHSADNGSVPGPSTSESPRGSIHRTSRRGAKFNAGLTHNVHSGDQTPHVTPSQLYKTSVPKQDDLTSILIHALRTPPFPDCPICFSAIRPEQATWSCSPSIPIVSDMDNMQCCWTTFHIKCIRSWATKSVKDVADAWRVRGEHKSGDWRCPGCQAKREVTPSEYRCFCDSTPEPKPSRLSTPHSCANTCSRPRGCGHACPISCHPGPCPPCQVTTHLPCHCGSQDLAFKCSRLKVISSSEEGVELSCGNVCGKKLTCGNHTCQVVCHPGECSPCPVREEARCYCGKVVKDIGCGEGKPLESAVDARPGKESEHWVGRFGCDNVCERDFDCGIHHCSKQCHPPSRHPPPCPYSPSSITHCPCGKHLISSSSSSSFSRSQVEFLSRTKCTDPIPTCTSTCLKPLAGCSHVCSIPCHAGPCPPCSITLVRPCRCGTTTRDMRCSTVTTYEKEGIEVEILCDKPCTALRACGRHQCNRVCCPLASLAGGGKGKGKKRNAAVVLDATEGGLHECDLVCGKMLACGNHRCEEKDHRGACPPCLRSSFEEMICYCGQTVLEPPIPCGTQINCTYPCTRLPPPCGHPKTQHSCHEDPSSCPPCPFLTNKTCACGKKVVGNVRCSQEKVACGTPCGKQVACGFHHCERLCHGDDCGQCTAACGKPRKLCLPAYHSCVNACHAPSTCSEVEPCESTITLACPCGRIRQSVLCGRSISNPLGREGTAQLKCSNECNIAKRNAKLADALGINIESRGKDKEIVWSDDLIGFAKLNARFLPLVESTFADFVGSEKKTQVLPHMPPDRRKFVHDMAAVYRMDTQLVDQEPHRSVQLIRRVDTRIPTPLLSSSIPSSSSLNFGKLANLRAQGTQALNPIRSPVPTVTGPSRGWTSVVARSENLTPKPSVATPKYSSVSNNDNASAAVRNVPHLAVSEEIPDNWEDEV